MNNTIVLSRRPDGKPQLADFKFVTESMPIILNGEILLKTTCVSVDPYLRGRMSDAKSYAVPFELQKPISSGIIAQVVESKQDGFAPGDFVSGLLERKEYHKSNGEGLMKIDASKGSHSAYLGILGMPGLTAYLGLSEIGKLKKGESVVVSGAAGAVGCTVGQIAKIGGCHVVGIAGSDEKVKMLTTEFGFDQIPQAFIHLFEGKNKGKMIIKI